MLRLKKAARGIGLYVNSDITELICFKENGAISTVSGKLLKCVDQFIYLGSNISSTESGINICIGKAWIAIDRLSIIWKSDLPNEIKQEFFRAVPMSVLLYDCTTKTLMKCMEKNGNYTRTLHTVLNKFWK